MKPQSTVTPLRRMENATPRNVETYSGGKRWGYPLAFKMEVIRAVREQGMSISQALRKFDISDGTLRRWLDYYDLKRIPPKGANEYPAKPQEKDAPAHVAEPVQNTAPHSERRETIRDAIGLLKQAVDLLHAACQPKHTTGDKA